MPRAPQRRAHNQGTSIYKRPDGRWTTQISLADGSRKSIYGKTSDEVYGQYLEIMGRLRKGEEPLPEKETLAQHLDWWLEHVAKTLDWRTYQTYRGYTQNHLIPGLGKHRLARLTAKQVQEFLDERAVSGLSARTVGHIRAVLRAALSSAQAHGKLHQNVAKVAKPPKVDVAPVSPLTPPQARAFVAAVMDEPLGAAYILPLCTTLRQSEVLGLRWQDVDWVRGTITVIYQLQRVRGELVLKRPKTRPTNRTIALPQVAIVALQTRQEAQRQAQAKLGPSWTNWKEEGLVFTREDGFPLDGTVVTHRFQKLLKTLGLPRQRYHDLRHGAVSLLIYQGANLKEVSAAAGHSNVNITLNLYGHLFEAYSQELAHKMDAALGEG